MKGAHQGIQGREIEHYGTQQPSFIDIEKVQLTLKSSQQAQKMKKRFASLPRGATQNLQTQNVSHSALAYQQAAKKSKRTIRNLAANPSQTAHMHGSPDYPHMDLGAATKSHVYPPTHHQIAPIFEQQSKSQLHHARINLRSREKLPQAPAKVWLQQQAWLNNLGHAKHYLNAGHGSVLLTTKNLQSVSQFERYAKKRGAAASLLRRAKKKRDREAVASAMSMGSRGSERERSNTRNGRIALSMSQRSFKMGKAAGRSGMRLGSTYGSNQGMGHDLYRLTGDSQRDQMEHIAEISEAYPQAQQPVNPHQPTSADPAYEDNQRIVQGTQME